MDQIHITGTIALPDGSTSEFQILADFAGLYPRDVSSAQWGAPTHRLGRTVNLLEAMRDSVYEHLSEEDV
jgi:hypothetical protein